MLDYTHLTLLENNLLVRLLAPAIKSKGGIVMPEAGRQRQQCGIVLAVGPGETLESGAVVPVRIPVGALVLFNRHAGIAFESDDPSLFLLRTNEVPAYFPPGTFAVTEHADTTQWHLADAYCDICDAPAEAEAAANLEAERARLRAAAEVRED